MALHSVAWWQTRRALVINGHVVLEGFVLGLQETARTALSNEGLKARKEESKWFAVKMGCFFS